MLIMVLFPHIINVNLSGSMKINQTIIKDQVDKALGEGYIEIVDHRRNTIVLNNGAFEFNGCTQPKSKASIEAIFLEAFRLTRFVRIDDQEFTRERNKWYLKSA